MAPADARMCAVQAPETSADARPDIGRAPAEYPTDTAQFEDIGRLPFDCRTASVWTLGGLHDT